MVKCENEDIYWYNSVDYVKRDPCGLVDLPGYDLFKNVHVIWAPNLSLSDRAGIIKFPVKTKIADFLKLPEFVQQTETLEEVCILRAQNLMEHAKRTNRKIFIMYSGGIDSSIIVVSFFLGCSIEDIRKYVVVGLSEASIREHPTLYKDWIVRYMTVVTSSNFPIYVGNDNYIMVSGEGGDQLFGAVFIRKLCIKFGEEIINTPWSEDVIIKCFNFAFNDIKIAERFWQIFSRAVKAAPIQLTTVYQFFWWLNFTTKVQNVYMRNIAFIQDLNRNTIKPEDNYISFFTDKKIQLWVMNNPDKLVKDTWLSYKYECKNIIYKLTKDANYRDRKAKFGSFGDVNKQHPMGTSVTTSYKVTTEDLTRHYWNEDNDFV